MGDMDPEVATFCKPNSTLIKGIRTGTKPLTQNVSCQQEVFVEELGARLRYLKVMGYHRKNNSIN